MVTGIFLSIFYIFCMCCLTLFCGLWYTKNRMEIHMYLKAITKKGVSRLYLYESYYKNDKANQRCIESLGRLDELQKQFVDPVSHFKKIAQERTDEKKNSRKALFPLTFPLLWT